jgi:tight adherence protein C
MAMPIVLVVAVLSAAASVSLAVLAVALPPTRGERLLRTLAAFGRTGGKLIDDRAPRWDERLRRSAVGGLDRLGRAVTPPGGRARLSRLLNYAGNPDDRPLELVIRRRGLLLLGGGAGGALFGAIVAGPVGALLGGPAGAVLGLFRPDLSLHELGVKRQRELAASLPDVLDAMVIGVEAGLGLDAAMQQVAENLTGPMPSEVNRVLQEMRIGISRTDALHALSDRTTVRSLQNFVTAVVQAGELGVPIADVLREHARVQRVKRRQEAEERAQKVPVKLLFPVIFCLFPATFVVILGPGVLRLLAALGR